PGNSGASAATAVRSEAWDRAQRAREPSAAERLEQDRSGRVDRETAEQARRGAVRSEAWDRAERAREPSAAERLHQDQAYKWEPIRTNGVCLRVHQGRYSTALSA